MTDLVIPTIGESIKTVFIARWFVKVGDTLAEGKPVLEIDSDKASLEVPAPCAGTVTELLAEEGDEVRIGAVIARIDELLTSHSPQAPSVKTSPGSAAKAGPAARQAASKAGIELGRVQGSGPRGRILSGDVTALSTPARTSAAVASAGQASTPPPPSPLAEERVKMTPYRRTIARRLVEAQQNAAMLTTFNEVDMSRVMALRKEYQEGFQARYGIKLGFMSFFVKASIEALKAFPSVNAEIDGDEIVYKRFYNIGVAVSGPRGLAVPVIKAADQLSFAETEQAIAELSRRARDNKLRVEDFLDGTFTISNGGIFGSLMSTPILNPPQVGILGMHAINQRPMGVEGRIELRPMMYLAVSYDHRLIDGREAVGFLKRIKDLVEAPERILLEV